MVCIRILRWRRCGTSVSKGVQTTAAKILDMAVEIGKNVIWEPDAYHKDYTKASMLISDSARILDDIERKRTKSNTK